MATGISGQEKLSPDSLNAALPHKDPHPLPLASDTPLLIYPNRLSEADVLSSLRTSFIQMDGEAHSSLIQKIPTNSLVLADNLFGLTQGNAYLS
jgi:hypothetical protein